MSESTEPLAELKKYLLELDKSLLRLLKILEFEKADIEASDEEKLTAHTALEREETTKIEEITRTVKVYLDETVCDGEAEGLLKEIEVLKKEAYAAGIRNISMLKGELLRLKSSLAALNLPKTARRVYYSGDTSTIMDIEI
jgi:hypothetical protein